MAGLVPTQGLVRPECLPSGRPVLELPRRCRVGGQQWQYRALTRGGRAPLLCRRVIEAEGESRIKPEKKKQAKKRKNHIVHNTDLTSSFHSIHSINIQSKTLNHSHILQN